MMPVEFLHHTQSKWFRAGITHKDKTTRIAVDFHEPYIFEALTDEDGDEYYVFRKDKPAKKPPIQYQVRHKE
jgi:hypothetical protein